MSGSEIIKGGLAASLLFCALAVAAWGSVHASPTVWFVALALLWGGSRFVPGELSTGTSALAASVYALAAWMVCTNLWANPSYTAAAPYHAGFLLGGFLLGRRASREGVRLLFGVGLAYVLCAAVWALWLQVVQAEARAHGLFVTPATLASVLNLLLLPTFVLVAGSRRRATLIGALVILSAGLVAAQSRGGWIAFAAAGVFAWALARRGRLGVDIKAAGIVAAALALGCGLAGLVQFLWGAGEPTTSMIDARATLSSVSRLELYALALKSLTPSVMLFGSGYQSFFYVMEAGRASVLSYAESTTYFVHNDYLQVLLELGLPGFAALLAIVVGPLALSWRAATQIPGAEARVTLVAAVAAIASMAVHAFVDFPFGIPLCLLLYGAALGVIDAVLLRNEGLRPLRLPFTAQNARLLSALRVGIATIVIWILAVPVVAEAASEYGQREWKLGHAHDAVLWLEVARRVDPHDWRYHWYVGQFWMVNAEGRADPASANLADAAYARGYKANPREVRNLLDRIYLNSRLRHLLDAPAAPATLCEWSAHSVSLAPLDSVVRAQARRVMQQFGCASARPQ